MAPTVPASSQWARTLNSYTTTWESELPQLLFFLRGDRKSQAPIIEIDAEGGRPGLEQEFLFMRLTDNNPVPKSRNEPVIGVERSAPEPLKFRIICEYCSPYDFYLTHGTGDQQRTERNLEDEQWKNANDSTAVWMERSFYRQLAGDTRYNSGTTFTGLSHYADHKMSGMNAVTHYDTRHIGYADSGSGTPLSTTAGVAADTSAILSDVQVARFIAKLTTKRFGVKWPLTKMNLAAFGSGFLCITTQEGINQIKFSDPDSKFEKIDLAEMAGGMGFDNSALSKTTAIKSVNDVIYVAAEWLPLAADGVVANSTTPATGIVANCQPNIILGSHAALLWWMEGYNNGNHVDYTSDMEHERESIKYHTGLGFKRLHIDGESFGSAIFHSYTEATTEA